MVGIVVGNQVDGRPDDLVRIARDDGRFVQADGFRDQADRHLLRTALLAQRPVSHIGEDDLDDGLVGLDGEFTVGIRDSGIMTFRNGYVDRLQRAARHSVQNFSGHDIPQPDGIRLGEERKGKDKRRNQCQKLPEHPFCQRYLAIL